MHNDNRPNILFLFADQHRWDWLGRYGDIPVRTPNLDALAARGVAFEQCRVNSPVCGPSRACLATGRRYKRAGILSNRTGDLDRSLPTFMKQLRAAGYQVGVTGKTHLHIESKQFGDSGWSSVHGQLGFTRAVDCAGKRDGCQTVREPYGDFLRAHGKAEILANDLERRAKQLEAGEGMPAEPIPFERQYQNDDFVGSVSRDMLRTMPGKAPWFMQVNFGSPHAPFDACEELASRYKDVVFPDPIAPKPQSEEPTDHQAVRRQYAAMIEGMDEWVGWLIEEVEARGELDNTIILFSADHGEGLGDLGKWNKGFTSDPSVRVPLIAAGPGIAQGVNSEALVELIDLAATFVDIADAEPIKEADARSFLPVLKGESTQHRTHTVSALAKWRMITDGRWKYACFSDDREEELYDLQNDPHEMQNVAAENRNVATQLREALDAEPG